MRAPSESGRDASSLKLASPAAVEPVLAVPPSVVRAEPGDDRGRLGCGAHVAPTKIRVCNPLISQV